MFRCMSPIIPEWMETTQKLNYTVSYDIYFEVRLEGSVEIKDGRTIEIWESKCVQIEKTRDRTLPILEYETVFSRGLGTTRVTFQQEMCTGQSSTVYVEETTIPIVRNCSSVKLVQRIFYRDQYGEREKQVSIKGRYIGLGRYVLNVPDTFVDSSFGKDRLQQMTNIQQTKAATSPSDVILVSTSTRFTGTIFALLPLPAQQYFRPCQQNDLCSCTSFGIVATHTLYIYIYIYTCVVCLFERK